MLAHVQRSFSQRSVLFFVVRADRRVFIERRRPPARRKRRVSFAAKMMMIGRLSSSVVALGVLLVSFAFDKHCEAQSVPTPAPTDACLPENQAAINQCFTDNSIDGQACVDCHNAYIDMLPSDLSTMTCDELSTLICNQIDTCASTCGTCGSSLEAFETCKWSSISNCYVSCSPTPTTPSFPTSPVAPAPSPSAPSLPTTPSPPTSTECDTEKSAFVSCVTSTGDATACQGCLDTYGGSTTITTCDEAQAFTCGLEAACPECGTCEAENVAVTDCLNAGLCNAVDCTSPTPSSPVAPPPTPTASESGPPSLVPSPLLTTSAPSAAPTSDPTSDPTSAPSLQVMTFGPVPIPPSPVSAPVPSPTIPTSGNGADERCPSELDTYKDCIATKLSSADAASCESCVKDALDGFLSIARQAPSCSSVNEAICPALEGGASSSSSGACGCGTCADELQLYLACSVDALTTGCDLACAGTTPLPGTTSGAAGQCRRFAIVGMVAVVVAAAALGGLV
jgi:hypothetical protein